MIPRYAAILASLLSTACTGDVPTTRIAFPEGGVDEIWDPPRFEEEIRRAEPAVEVELLQVGELSLEGNLTRPLEAFVDDAGRIVVREASAAIVFASTGERAFEMPVGDRGLLFTDGGNVCMTDGDDDCHRCSDGRGTTLLCLPFGDLAVDPTSGRRWLTFWIRPDLIYGMAGGDRFDRMIDRAPDGLRWREIYGLACDRAGDLAVLDGPRQPLSCFPGFESAIAPVGDPPREGVVLALLSWDRGVLGAIDVTDVTQDDLRWHRLRARPKTVRPERR